MSEIRRRIFNRIVIWQPASGTIANLPTRTVLSFDGPSNSEEYAELTDGSKRPIRRSSRVQVPILDREAALMSTLFQRTNCPVKAAFLGGRKADHWLWLESTRANITDSESEAGNFAPKVIDLESNIFYPAIWEGMDLVENVPWQGTESTGFNNDVRRGFFLINKGLGKRPGYEGPLWSAGSSVSVNMTGDAANLDPITKARITFEFPVWGSEVELNPIPGYNIVNPRIVALGWNGNVIDSASGQPLVVPLNTWKIAATVDGASARPRLNIKSAGINRSRVYTGNTTTDCTQGSTEPPWDPLPDPIVPNDPPTWQNRDEVEWTVPGSKLDPVFGPTKGIWTSDGGFSSYDYPSVNNFQNYLDDKAYGELAIDPNAGYVFLSHEDGIFRYDLQGQNETHIYNNPGINTVGLAVDQALENLYVSHENTDGIFRLNYDGSQYQEIGNISHQDMALEVSGSRNDSLIIGVSAAEGEVWKWNLDGTGETSIKTDSNLERFVDIHVESQTLYVEVRSSTSVQYERWNFNGTNTFDVLLFTIPSGTPPRPSLTVLQKEDKLVYTGRAEGTTASVTQYDLDFTNSVSIGPITNADTGTYAVAQIALYAPNLLPIFDQREDLEYDNNILPTFEPFDDVKLEIPGNKLPAFINNGDVRLEIQGNSLPVFQSSGDIRLQLPISRLPLFSIREDLEYIKNEAPVFENRNNLDFELVLNVLPSFEQRDSLEYVLNTLPQFSVREDLEYIKNEVPVFENRDDLDFELNTLPSFEQRSDLEYTSNELPNFEQRDDLAYTLNTAASFEQRGDVRLEIPSNRLPLFTQTESVRLELTINSAPQFEQRDTVKYAI